MFFFKKRNESPEAVLKEVEEHLQRGRNFTMHGQDNEAEKEFLKCLSILEPLSRKSESPIVDQELAKTYDLLCLMCLGKTTIKTKQDEGVAYGKKAVEIRKKSSHKTLQLMRLTSLHTAIPIWDMLRVIFLPVIRRSGFGRICRNDFQQIPCLQKGSKTKRNS